MYVYVLYPLCLEQATEIWLDIRLPLPCTGPSLAIWPAPCGLPCLVMVSVLFVRSDLPQAHTAVRHLSHAVPAAGCFP